MEGFAVASGLREASAVINKVPAEKFPLILGRVLDTLHVDGAKAFSAAEEGQLCARYGLTVEDLALVLDACVYIFEQAAFASIEPEPLFTALQEAGCHEAHAKAAGRVWAKEGAAFVARLKGTRTLGASSLVHSEFRLNLVMAQGGHGEGLFGPRKINEPTALIEFTLANGSHSSAVPTPGSDGATSDSSNTTKFGVEMSHEELYTFFRQLEKVQHEHLDSLS